jgi:hypothetical protein
MGTRLWEVSVLETDEQIKAALEKRVQLELTREWTLSTSLVEYQEYLQYHGPWDAIVPFAGRIVEGIIYKGMDPRIQRDFQRILSLIKAVTVLRHQQRQRDANGRWVATLEDYSYVREVLNDTYSATANDGITRDVRMVVKAVAKLREKAELSVTYDQVAKHLEWNKMKSRRKAAIAIKHGWIVNRQDKRGQPADLVIGDPMPNDRALPNLLEEGEA